MLTLGGRIGNREQQIVRLRPFTTSTRSARKRFGTGEVEGAAESHLLSARSILTIRACDGALVRNAKAEQTDGL
jgi:hypothetical protein